MHAYRQIGNSTTIRRTTVRGAYVPRHHGVPIKSLLKRLEHHGNIVPRGTRGSFNWAPIMLEAQASQTVDENNSSLAVSGSRREIEFCFWSNQIEYDCIEMFSFALEPTSILGEYKTKGQFLIQKQFVHRLPSTELCNICNKSNYGIYSIIYKIPNLYTQIQIYISTFRKKKPVQCISIYVYIHVPLHILINIFLFVFHNCCNTLYNFSLQQMESKFLLKNYKRDKNQND